LPLLFSLYFIIIIHSPFSLLFFHYWH
jgi:hypothetical protein